MPIVVDHSPFGAILDLATMTGQAQKTEKDRARDDQLAELIRQNNFRNKQLRQQDDQFESNQEFQREQSQLDRLFQGQRDQQQMQFAFGQQQLQQEGYQQRNAASLLSDILTRVPPEVQKALQSGELFYTPEQKRRISQLSQALSNPSNQNRSAKITGALIPKMSSELQQLIHNPAGVGTKQVTPQEEVDQLLVTINGQQYVAKKNAQGQIIGVEDLPDKKKADEVKLKEVEQKEKAKEYDLFLQTMQSSMVSAGENGGMRLDKALLESQLNTLKEKLGIDFSKYQVQEPPQLNKDIPPINSISQNDIMAQQGVNPQQEMPPMQGQMQAASQSIDPVSGADLSIMQKFNTTTAPSVAPDEIKSPSDFSVPSGAASQLPIGITGGKGSANEPFVIGNSTDAQSIMKLLNEQVLDGQFVQIDGVTFRWNKKTGKLVG